jgi:hypothetical protein
MDFDGDAQAFWVVEVLDFVYFAVYLGTRCFRIWITFRPQMKELTSVTGHVIVVSTF